MYWNWRKLINCLLVVSRWLNSFIVFNKKTNSSLRWYVKPIHTSYHSGTDMSYLLGKYRFSMSVNMNQAQRGLYTKVHGVILSLHGPEQTSSWLKKDLLNILNIYSYLKESYRGFALTDILNIYFLINNPLRLVKLSYWSLHCFKVV